MRNKKILIVSYYWFPFTGTGTYRISKFTKYLKRRGWEPMVLTARKSTGNLLEQDIPPEFRDIPVFRTPIFEPAELVRTSGADGEQRAINPSVFYAENKRWYQKLAIWLRLHVLIPDAKISWRFLSIRKGKEIIRNERPALILSTSPPPTAHLVAKKLAGWSKLPWVADFRDPWTNIYYYDDVRMNPIAQKINEKLEQSVLDRADRVTLVNEGFFPGHAPGGKAAVIHNGYDTEDFPDRPPESRNELFTICYTGSLKMNQHPEGLIKALKELSSRHPEKAGNIRLEFYGDIDSRISEAFRHEEIVAEISHYGLVPRNEALNNMMRADMQLLIIGKQPRSKPVLSTKVFEYMQSSKPILGIGHADGAAAEIVRKTGTGYFFSHDDHEGIKKCILNGYESWRNNEPFIHPNAGEIEQFDFRQLTSRLEKVLESALNSRETESRT